MKFSINRSELQHALSIVSKGVSTRSTLPVLSGILIEALQDGIRMQATDLELSIQYQAPALVEEPGRTVVPGKLFLDIIKNLPDAAVSVNGQGETAQISCDSSSFTIRTLNAEDFPEFPQVEVQQQIGIPFTDFSRMVKRVARMVSKDETRAILTGVLITVEDGNLKMVATDSYRLAVTEVPFTGSGDESFSAVIAGKFLTDVTALQKVNEVVTLGLAENQIVISCGDTLFINRRIEGNFPNYKQLLPENYATRAEIETSELVSGIRRASLLGSSTSPVRLDLNINSQTLQIATINQDLGSSEEVLGCTVEGEDMEIAFNYAYVLDGLSVVGTDKVVLELQSPLKPGIFRATEPDNFLYLVMPIRIS